MDSAEQQQQQQQQLAQEQEQQQQQSQYVANYPVTVVWPPKLVNLGDNSKNNNATAISNSTKTAASSLRTSPELVQHRLLESNVLFEVPVPLGQLLNTCMAFTHDLERTGAYRSVQVELAPVGGNKSTTTSSDDDSKQTLELRVVLDEKNYHLYAGGGLNPNANSGGSGSLSTSGSSSGGGASETPAAALHLPKGELQLSAGLRNLTGHTDHTSVNYTLDTSQIPSWSVVHERPLYACLRPSSSLRDSLLLTDQGSQWALSVLGNLQTVDYASTRGYHEFQRSFTVRVANVGNVATPEQAPGVYYGLSYQTLFRDLVPPQRPLMPPSPGDAASPLTASFLAHPALIPDLTQPHATMNHLTSTKHSITAQITTNGTYLNHPALPTQGWSANLLAEWAFPNEWSIPGLPSLDQSAMYTNKPASSASFLKFVTNLAYHQPLVLQANHTLAPQLEASSSLPSQPSDGLALHLHGHAGLVVPMVGGKEGSPSTTSSADLHPSDRLYMGGPWPVRGFLPAGIGPRGKSLKGVTGGPSHTPNGPALGGDLTYAVTALLSAPLPMFDDTSSNEPSPLRAFGFCTAAHCVGSWRNLWFGAKPAVLAGVSPWEILRQSGRVSAGVGVAGTLGGNTRCELLFSWPLQYDATTDARRNLQVAFGFSMAG